MSIIIQSYYPAVITVRLLPALCSSTVWQAANPSLHTEIKTQSTEPPERFPPDPTPSETRTPLTHYRSGSVETEIKSVHFSDILKLKTNWSRPAAHLPGDQDTAAGAQCEIWGTALLWGSWHRGSMAHA